MKRETVTKQAIGFETEYWSQDIRKEYNSHYRSTMRGKVITLLGSARNRAKRLGVEFSLSFDWLHAKLTDGVCPITGMAFDMSGGGRTYRSPSIERVIPELGYTEDNCIVVVWIYNAAKCDGTHDEVVEFAKSLLSRLNQN